MLPVRRAQRSVIDRRCRRLGAPPRPDARRDLRRGAPSPARALDRVSHRECEPSSPSQEWELAWSHDLSGARRSSWAYSGIRAIVWNGKFGPNRTSGRYGVGHLA